MKTKKDAIAWVIVLLLVILFVWQLPHLYSLTSTKKEKEDVKKEEVREVIPDTYNCELIDNTTSSLGYTGINKVNFTFNDNGSIKKINAKIEIKYKDKNIYNAEKDNNYDNDGITSIISNDDANKTRVITLDIDYSKYKKEETDDKVMNIINNYPSNYKELKKYLSNHLYSCH